MTYPTPQPPVTRVMLGRYTPEPGAISQHPGGWLTCLGLGMLVRGALGAWERRDVGALERYRGLLAGAVEEMEAA